MNFISSRFLATVWMCTAIPPIHGYAAELAEGTISADKFELRYIADGDGPPAIAIGSSIYLQRAFSQDLRRSLRMIFVDTRGYAPSPGPQPKSAFSREKVISDIERTRQKLGLGKVIVIGHSIHGIIVLEYAKEFPKNVSHVVMIGSPPTPFAENSTILDQYWEAMASPERKSIMSKNYRRLPDEELANLPPGERFISAYLRDTPRIWFDPHFDASVIWGGVKPNDAWGAANPFPTLDLTKGLSTLDRPVMLVLGRYDFLAPPPVWDRYKSQFRDLKIKVFDKSGHWPHYEEPVGFDNALLDWLGQKQSTSN